MAPDTSSVCAFVCVVRYGRWWCNWRVPAADRRCVACV